MKFLYVLAFCLALSISYAADDATLAPDNRKTTHHTTTAPSTSTTTQHITSSSSPSPTTAPPTVPSTTAPPPTTPSTTAPPPTTPSTTAPPPTTPSTTAPPPTTPSTSPAPPSSTTPPPPNKEWYVVDPITHDICIIAAMDVYFHLQAGNSSHYSTSDIKVDPATAHVLAGTCGNETQVLRLMWPQLEVNSTMAVTFTKKNENYYISSLDLALAYNSSEGVKHANFSSVNLTLFETNVNSSYSCGFYEIPEVTNDLKEKVEIKMSGLHVEAFRTGKTTNFNTAHYCPGEVPDIVPLVVGICLAGLVLVVVIAYLIGRRRSQNSGYLSM